ncbi:PQQ-binding-like beta-propeller repeat protein [Streptomyces sp. W16]|uniref:outer membrane protein assembly factor BamB family protein n=1 Tax=Streptomyces sp. W16 TaxID=3076631 RepID=UPI00295B8C16|nr:PQQ-binding-like beta-propeller repeat protein [Streptomyces sp. W16]MDV9176107.1 PQQ-binding-like beta-propeller repeat protein [Streptomyces sp. W16]
MADDRVPLSVTADPERRLWTLRAVGAGVGEPVVVGGTVYVSVPGERIAALDAGSGRVRWCSGEVAEVWPPYVAVAGAVAVVPVLQEMGRGVLIALDAATGKARWTRRESALHRVVAVGDSAFVVWSGASEERGSVAGVDALTGETLWEHEFEGIKGLLVRGELVILGADRFRALHGRSGDEIWNGGDGTLLTRAGGVEDAAVFLCWRGGYYEPKSLVVRASDTGAELTGTRFPEKALKHFWRHPELVDGGRVLFARSCDRRIQLFAYGGLDRARALGSWKLGRLRHGTLREVACVGDWVYALNWSGRVYAVEVGRRRGLRRLTMRGRYERVLRDPLHLTAGPGYVLASGRDGVGMLRDGRVLWVSDTIRPDFRPVPLDGDRVLFRARSRNDKETRLYCADVETGRRLLP